MAYLLTQFVIRHGQIQAELEREHAKAADRRVVPLAPRRQGWVERVREAAVRAQTAARIRARASLNRSAS